MRARWLALAGCLVATAALVLLTVPFPVLAGAHPHVDVLGDFTPRQLAREEAFHHAIRPSAYASLLLALLVAGVLGLTRWGPRLMARLPGHWTARAALGTVLLLTATRVAALALDMQSERVLRRYGLSTQDWPAWAADQLKAHALSCGTTVLVVLVLLTLARALPRGWWAAGAVCAALLVMGGSYVYPVVVEPMFNDFTSLPAGELRSDLLRLAARDGVPVEDVLVADASRRTTALNAYVSGFGASRRIVVYDTLLTSSTPREVELVVAHELGHAKRQDVLHGTLIGALLGAAGSCALSLLLGSRRVLDRLEATGPGDPRVLPLVLFLAAAVPLLVAPASNLVSRHVEARADLHALDLTGDVDTFVASEQRLSTVNLSDLRPSPLAYALFFTHPTGPERIALAREWRRLHPP
jgi:STE24 endopeptidase